MSLIKKTRLKFMSSSSRILTQVDVLQKRKNEIFQFSKIFPKFFIKKGIFQNCF
jgi:hypothetical protein